MRKISTIVSSDPPPPPLFCIFARVLMQALKLGLHRKFSDHLALVKEAMKIFLRSSVLLLVLVRMKNLEGERCPQIDKRGGKSRTRAWPCNLVRIPEWGSVVVVRCGCFCHCRCCRCYRCCCCCCHEWWWQRCFSPDCCSRASLERHHTPVDVASLY